MSLFFVDSELFREIRVKENGLHHFFPSYSRSNEALLTTSFLKRGKGASSFVLVDQEWKEPPCRDIFCWLWIWLMQGRYLLLIERWKSQGHIKSQSIIWISGIQAWSARHTHFYQMKVSSSPIHVPKATTSETMTDFLLAYLLTRTTQRSKRLMTMGPIWFIYAGRKSFSIKTQNILVAKGKVFCNLLTSNNIW